MNYRYRFGETHQQEDPMFLGRRRELDLFREVLSTTIGATVINVYGTGGIGKSSLLSAFQRSCSQSGYRDFAVEGHSSIQTPSAFCSHLLEIIEPSGQFGELSNNDVVAFCIEQIGRLHDQQPVVLLLDGYECIESMDSWLREHFLIRLPERLITVIAGRLPLSEAWYLSPEWRKRLLSLPLPELDFAAVRQFCHMNGVYEEPSIIQLWNETRGHPLMMAIAVVGTSQTMDKAIEEQSLRAPNMDFLSYIVERWLREVPDPAYRTLVEAASTLRYFNQDILSHVLDRVIDTIDFRRLIRYSFVYKTSHGWRIHDLLRSAIVQDLNSRSPLQYEHYLIRIVSYYYEHLTSGKRNNETTWYAGELMYYIGGPIPRAFLHGLDASPRYFSHASADDMDAIKLFLNKRNKEARDTVVRLFDPYSNKSFTFEQTKQQSRYSLKWVNLNELRMFGRDCLRIVKDAQEQLAGLAVILPINQRTLSYLLDHPLSASYFQGLDSDQLASYSVPDSTRSGWFIHTIDIDDFENTQLHFSIAHLIISLVFSGERIVVSPPPIPYFTEALESMLFKTVMHGMHKNYDGHTLSPTYILDTRGDRLLDYLDHMMKLAGIELIVPKEPSRHVQEPQDMKLARSEPDPGPAIVLSEREQHVAELLREGLTNAQIAGRLHLSEITIKKHLNTMFQKFEVTNRTLLLTKLINLYWKS